MNETTPFRRKHVGEPHLHFISSAWGIKRQHVLENLAAYRYNLNAETIKFEPTDFGDRQSS